MKRKLVAVLLCGILAISTLAACGSTKETDAATKNTVEESAEEAETAEEDATKEAEAEEAYEAGQACLYGLDGQKKDLGAAYNYFEKALELGKAEANFYLGVLYDWESYPEQDFEKARAYYEAAGENPYAYVSLGFNNYYGQGGEVNKEKGKEYFEKAIALGCNDGYLGLGSIAKSEEDYAAAMENYNLVVENGTESLYVRMAMKEISLLYRDGLGVEQDGAKVIEWLEKMALAGDSDGYNFIGVMYLNGNGVEQDYTKAKEWYEKGVEQGNATSMANIGHLYRDGLGVEQDGEKAIEWFEKAGLAGYGKGYYLIGDMYYEGNGVEQDYTKALEWFEKGAELGDVDSMGMLAVMYHEGNGVEQDLEKAMEWYEKYDEAISE